jgi:hypothetical protein
MTEGPQLHGEEFDAWIRGFAFDDRGGSDASATIICGAVV